MKLITVYPEDLSEGSQAIICLHRMPLFANSYICQLTISLHSLCYIKLSCFLAREYTTFSKKMGIGVLASILTYNCILTSLSEVENEKKNMQKCFTSICTNINLELNKDSKPVKLAVDILKTTPQIHLVSSSTSAEAYLLYSSLEVSSFY